MSTVRANNYYDASGGSNAQLYGVASPPNSMGFRNRILNGGMVIDQRNAGASVSVANNAVTYTVDRWLVYSNNDGFCSMQQVSDAPAGFVKSLRFTTTTADSSLSATQRAMIQHRIEGFNASDFGWGAAGAQTVTLSFWVKSTLTGSFGGAIQNEAVNRAYPFSYTINSANTWEQKTITIPGDTTGTWATDNTCWARVVFGLGVGSTYSGTANSWAASDLNSVTGAVSVIGTLNATWQITGVQLEAGTVASPFERRDYGRELIMCQRYYQTNLPSTSYANSTTGSRLVVVGSTSMRTTPTVTLINGTNALEDFGVATRNISSLASSSLTSGNATGGLVDSTTSSTTASKPIALFGNTIALSAEL